MRKTRHSIRGHTNETNTKSSFDIIDATYLKIECYDSDVGSDDLIGVASLSLASAFELGHVDTSVTLIHATKKSEKPAGELKLSLNFWAPPSVKFPQRKGPSAKTFGDRRRRGKGHSRAGMNESAVLDMAGGAEKIAEYMTLPGPLEGSGMMIVKVLEGQNVKGKDSKLTVYARVKIGNKKAGTKWSKTKSIKCKQARLANPVFNQEFEIPVIDIGKMVEDREVGVAKKKTEKDVFMYIEVWEDNFGLDALLGSCKVSEWSGAERSGASGGERRQTQTSSN